MYIQFNVVMEKGERVLQALKQENNQFIACGPSLKSKM